MFRLFFKLLVLYSILNLCFGDKEYVHEHVDSHYKDGVHNPEFDHEAIAGSKKAAEELQKLSPEELKLKFYTLLEKMDTNDDNYVSKEEIVAWVLSYFRWEDANEAEDRIQQLDGDGDEHISWEEYVTEVYSYSAEEIEKFRLDTTPDMVSFVKMVDDDIQRFKLADVDADGELNVTEYGAFLHPENYEYMEEYEIDQRLEEMDKNKDGQISYEEFIGEGVTDEEQRIVDQENFNYYDRNFNGQLDRLELRPWVIPNQKSMAVEEAEHLLSETDKDFDGKLAFDEILAKQELWIGSSVTAYGTGFNHDPDEL